MRRERTLLPLLLLAILWLGGASAEGAESSKVPRGYTLKIIGETEYLMPSAYIWNPRRRGSGVDKGFSIDAYFPDLAPLGPENKHIAEMKGGNQYMYSIHLDAIVNSVAQRYLNMRCGRGSGQYEYGLLKVDCDDKNIGSDVYIINSGSIFLFIRCSKQYAPSPACDLQFDHGGNAVSAFFPQRMLSDAPRVHRDIVGLLDEFVRAADALRHQAR